MDMVEAFGLRLGDGCFLNSDNFETSLLDFGENGSCIALADRVWLNDAKGALGHLV
jgi:hypothetical protein